MSEISQRERELLNEVAALRRRIAREETKEFNGTVSLGTVYPVYSGVPTAGAMTYWTGNGTIAAASFGTSVITRYSGVPTAGAMAYWTANGTVAAAGFGTSTIAQYSGTQSAGVFAYFTGTGTVTATATYGTATIVTLNVGDARYGLLATANTWTANNAFNSTATSGNALSVTRNLTSTSTDSPVVSIVQDHASDDQAALRVQQDGTGNILQLYDGASLAVVVKDGGNVGIGATAPTQLLTLNAALPIIEFDIATVAKAYIGVSSGTNAIITGSAAGDTVIRTANQKILISNDDGTTAHLSIGATGNVGIGAGTPTSPLHVLRNLAAASTDSPVVNIVQDHASDDQVVLRVQQDATSYAIDIAASLPFTFTNIGTGTYNRSVIYHDTTNGFLFDMARQTDAVGGTPIPWSLAPRGATSPWFKVDTNGNVGFNVATPLGKAHVVQSSTTAAIPVLHLKQSDLSEEFIRFETTVSAGNPINTTALGAYYGRVRVYVEGVGAKWLALYD